MESMASGAFRSDFGRILIFDDDKVFSESTADLLHREGYTCDCVGDITGAMRLLGENRYDLLIADIKMPGNSELELIRNMPGLAEGMPVILVTSHPCLGSAIESVRLGVKAYLVKPLDSEELLQEVRVAIGCSQSYRSIQEIKQRMQHWYEGLGDMEELLTKGNRNGLPVLINGFIELTFRNIIDGLFDIKHIMGILTEGDPFDKLPASPHTTGLRRASRAGGQEQVCHLFNCPRLESLRKGMAETIEVLEKTKSAFKSRDLGVIRGRLEEIISSKPSNG
jgi:FixJ family two-component response regulator